MAGLLRALALMSGLPNATVTWYWMAGNGEGSRNHRRIGQSRYGCRHHRWCWSAGQPRCDRCHPLGRLNTKEIGATGRRGQAAVGVVEVLVVPQVVALVIQSFAIGAGSTTAASRRLAKAGGPETRIELVVVEGLGTRWTAC